MNEIAYRYKVIGIFKDWYVIQDFFSLDCYWLSKQVSWMSNYMKMDLGDTLFLSDEDMTSCKQEGYPLTLCEMPVAPRIEIFWDRTRWKEAISC